MIKSAAKRVLPRSVRSALRHQRDALKDSMCCALSWPVRRLPDGPQETLRFVFESMPFTPELVIRGYQLGIFPKTDLETGALLWFDPDPRGVVFIEDFRVPRSVRGEVRRARKFDIRFDTDFEAVIRACAEPAPGRETTWITPQLIDAYLKLHELGAAHSVEAWQRGRLVGGGYGLALGGYFVLESMFHRVGQASKVAVARLFKRLEAGGFTILDCQWPEAHMEPFGATRIPRAEFKTRLAHALVAPASFYLPDEQRPTKVGPPPGEQAPDALPAAESPVGEG